MAIPVLRKVGNLDDTSDADKPVSTAQADALAGKLAKGADDSTTGRVTFDNTLGIKTQGAEGNPAAGVMYFGNDGSYILKFPVAFYFGNGATSVTATLDTGGTILTTSNFKTVSPPKAYRFTLAANYSNTEITAAANVTDGTTQWLLFVAAGKTYRVTITGNYQTASAVTGCRMQVTSGTAAGTLRGVAWALYEQFGMSKRYDHTISDLGVPDSPPIISTGTSAADVPHALGLEAVFVCTTSGNLIVRFASENAGSIATLLAGSTLTIEEI